MSDRRRFLLTLLLAVWVLCFAYAFVAFATAEPSGDGFTRGANRAGLFLGWQAVAGLVGLAAFAVSRDAPKGSGIRRVAAVPFLIALALLTLLVGFYAWAMLFA